MKKDRKKWFEYKKRQKKGKKKGRNYFNPNDPYLGDIKHDEDYDPFIDDPYYDDFYLLEEN